MVATVTESNLGLLRSFFFLCPMFHLKNIRKTTCLFLTVCLLMSPSLAEDQEFIEDFLKREYSLAKPYRGLGLSKQTGSRVESNPVFERDWELKVQFKIHGVGKKNLNGDGMAIWLTKDRMQNGPVFGNMDQFVGLGILLDTYPNADKTHDKSFPYVSLMLGNGTLSYDHDSDGRHTELGGCTAMVRNAIYDTFLLVRYSKNRLKLMVDVDGKQEWKDCADVTGLRLPPGYFFGASSATGDLSDNHDIISMKLYQLTIERSLEEEQEEEDVTVPRVDDMDQFTVEIQEESMSGVQFFFTVLFSILGLGVLAVVGLVVYGRWKENRRKRFY
ncbi:hypothetical protein KUCAC02_029191 [Chaenocephalus aceratus]|uniref:Uncharacterized protein n=1 Tax=Chaenocephalus aceratus TaxID=36190 RepID=A0ACB9X4Q4_CHAAC|nr:hypothetical protein KUCAC02_029191 [Chaenocephalus aceratus]